MRKRNYGCPFAGFGVKPQAIMHFEVSKTHFPVKNRKPTYFVRPPILAQASFMDEISPMIGDPHW